VSITIGWPVEDAQNEREQRRQVPSMTCTTVRRVRVLEVFAACRAEWHRARYGAWAPVRK
jgi:hypothetical protein